MDATDKNVLNIIARHMRDDTKIKFYVKCIKDSPLATRGLKIIRLKEYLYQSYPSFFKIISKYR